MKIIGIGGSLRKDSRTYLALIRALEEAKIRGCETDLIDLRELKLPFCNGSSSYPEFPDVMRLKQAVQNCQGMILSSPEYHGTISGILKNALDFLEIEDVRGKVVGLISVMGGETSYNALETMRTICRWLHAWTVPEQVAISKSTQAFDEHFNLKDAQLVKRLEEMVDSVIRMVRFLH